MTLHISRTLLSSHFTRKSSKEPLAIILPWMFSSLKQVDKYVQLYKSKGISNVLVVNPTFKEIFFPKFFIKDREQATENLLRRSSNSSCLIIHALSVGTLKFGGILVQMNEYLNQDQDHLINLVNNFKSLPKSLFMDSPTEPGVIYDALGYATFPGKIVSKKETILERVGWWGVKWSSLFVCRHLFPSSDEDMYNCLRHIENCKREFNFKSVVVVSSRSDPVVDFKYCYHLAGSLVRTCDHGQSSNIYHRNNKVIHEAAITKLIEECESSELTLKILDESPHVCHWMTNRQLYEDLIDYSIKSVH